METTIQERSLADCVRAANRCYVLEMSGWKIQITPAAEPQGASRDMHRGAYGYSVTSRSGQIVDHASALSERNVLERAIDRCESILGLHGSDHDLVKRNARSLSQFMHNCLG